MPAPASSEYYSLEKTAEVLGLPTAEVNRLREKSVLRAFRDGTSWKFRKSEVDDYLGETIKSRGKSSIDTDDAGGDSGFDLLNSDNDDEEAPTLLADSASFDSLMEDGDGLAINEDLVEVKPKSPLNLSKETASPAKQAGNSDVDLADDGLVLAESGTSSNLDLAGDSGLSLMNLAEEDLKPASEGGSDVELELNEDDDILSLMDDSALAGSQPAAAPEEDDFQVAGLDDEDASLDADLASSSKPVPPSSKSAAQPMPDFTSTGTADDFGTFDAPDGDLANDMFSGGVVPQPESPFGTSGSAAPADEMLGNGVFSSPAGETSSFGSGFEVSATSTFPAAAKTEAEYKPGVVIALISLTVLLVFPCIMLLDLMRNIWSWGEPFVINSALMDMIVGMVGLK
ncbi:hypothetical protein FACS189427_12970 [Planctomycetales bacterium]|nr:hypothetical protein FACS189427_12970 [Planctomycetales bacterium]